jgi:hypothetical protein
MIGDALYGGTELDGFPVWLANAWRVVLWLGMIAWLAKMVDRVIYSRRIESGSLYWLRFAVIILFARNAWAQAHNWDAPLAWDGVPITTLALACAWMSTYRYSHPAPGDPVLVFSQEERAPHARELRADTVRRYTSGDHPKRRATD